MYLKFLAPSKVFYSSTVLDDEILDNFNAQNGITKAKIFVTLQATNYVIDLVIISAIEEIKKLQIMYDYPTIALSGCSLTDLTIGLKLAGSQSDQVPDLCARLHGHKHA